MRDMAEGCSVRPTRRTDCTPLQRRSMYLSGLTEQRLSIAASMYSHAVVKSAPRCLAGKSLPSTPSATRLLPLTASTAGAPCELTARPDAPIVPIPRSLQTTENFQPCSAIISFEPLMWMSSVTCASLSIYVLALTLTYKPVPEGGHLKRSATVAGLRRTVFLQGFLSLPDQYSKCTRVCRTCACA